MKCSGPYTRVYLDATDAKAFRRLVDGLRGAGLRGADPRYPTNAASLDDLAFELRLENPGDGVYWIFRLAKFLGPKKMFGRGHVFEADVRRHDPDGKEDWRGHLFAEKAGQIVDGLLSDWREIASGGRPEAVVSGEDAHERRIELCNGI